MLYRFCSKFHAFSNSAKNFENQLRFARVAESLKVGTFLRHSVVLVGVREVGGLLQLHTAVVRRVRRDTRQ